MNCIRPLIALLMLVGCAWGDSKPLASHEEFPWSRQIPEAIHTMYVLPDTHLDERRDDWRREFHDKFAPLVKDCKTSGDAAVTLNAKMWDVIKVHYHPTKRPKPCQSPYESIAAGYASCTGLSILLANACRSVGVPARVVGTPAWTVPEGDVNGNHAGNHTWVEIWNGCWRFLGASENTALDETWFVGNAARATTGNPDHAIYASTIAPSSKRWPMVWSPADKSIRALDVTPFYTHRVTATFTLGDGLPVEIFLAGQLIAAGTGPRTVFRLAGKTTYQMVVGNDAPRGITLTDESVQEIKVAR